MSLTPATRTTARNAASKSISFCEKVKIKKMYYTTTRPEMEKRALWYSPEEFRRIRKEMIQTIRLMENDPTFVEDDHTHCARGLATYTKLGKQLSKDIKVRSIDCVLEAQEYNWNENMIAEYYWHYTSSSQELAHTIGKLDEEVVVQQFLSTIDDDEDEWAALMLKAHHHQHSRQQQEQQRRKQPVTLTQVLLHHQANVTKCAMSKLVGVIGRKSDFVIHKDKTRRLMKLIAAMGSHYRPTRRSSSQSQVVSATTKVDVSCRMPEIDCSMRKLVSMAA